MNTLPRRTKIICTIGPSTDSVESLIKLLNTGMDAARLNFSHGTHEWHLQTIKNIRAASDSTGKPVAILQDLQGPKIRTGKVENSSVQLTDDNLFTITIDDLTLGNSSKVGTTYKDLINEVKPGNTILVDDGYIILSVEKITKNDIITRVIKGGTLKNNKGIIAPGVSSKAPSMSEKDIDDLKFGLNAGVDAVGLSFVRSEADVIELKAAMKIFGRVIPVISKIERYEGYEDIEDIIMESDAIMVARGDLGLELPAETVPVLQKEIIKKCNYHGKPVIIATQMLESMIENPRPTRAEASDVANAVLDGTDCVMLSGETSTGKYPFEAVDYMNRIIRVIEEKYDISHKNVNLPNVAGVQNFRTPYVSGVQNFEPLQLIDVGDALGRASCVIAEQIKAAAIVPLTSSGFTAKNIAKYRPKIPIVALTEIAHTQRRLNSFVWGIEARLVPADITPEDIFNKLREYLLNLDYIKSGDYIVFVAGLSAGSIMPDNMLKVYQL
ncbi:MAG: pyruvate kinase [Bacteroidetes bacterium]|nr:pyruvate kinase [Bacteroidota bacterium]